MNLERFAARLGPPSPDETLPPGVREAAVAALLRFDHGEPEVLLMRRTEHPGDRWSGQISLPGGHRDPGDANLLGTAIREAREEVGLDLERIGRLLGRLPWVQAKARGRILPMHIAPYVFARSEEAEPRPGVEAEEVFWFPLGRAATGELDAVYEYRHEGRELELPSWHYEERVIWGLTHEMLTGLIRVLVGHRL